MILYQLKCTHDHLFEAWFRNSQTSDVQARDGEIECPYCGDIRVIKAPMAPNLHTDRSAAPPAAAPEKDAAAAGPSVQEETSRKLLEAFERLRKHVEGHFDYVGEKFAEEARRIHDGLTDERGIYGEATFDETKELAEDGIDVIALPPRRKTS